MLQLEIKNYEGGYMPVVFHSSKTRIIAPYVWNYPLGNAKGRLTKEQANELSEKIIEVFNNYIKSL
jgi:hypothetical protein